MGAVSIAMTGVNAGHHPYLREKPPIMMTHIDARLRAQSAHEVKPNIFPLSGIALKVQP